MDYKKFFKNSERQFGLLLSIVLLILAFFPFSFTNEVRYIFILLSIIALILSVISPYIFKLPNKLWRNLGIFLGKIINPVVMMVVYILIIVPSGFFARFFNKVSFHTKFDKSIKSYWIERKEQAGPFDKQF